MSVILYIDVSVRREICHLNFLLKKNANLITIDRGIIGRNNSLQPFRKLYSLILRLNNKNKYDENGLMFIFVSLPTMPNVIDFTKTSI